MLVVGELEHYLGFGLGLLAITLVAVFALHLVDLDARYLVAVAGITQIAGRTPYLAGNRA